MASSIYFSQMPEREKKGPHESIYTYESPEHAASTLQRMNEMRKSGEMCDIELRFSSGHTIAAHRVVLAGFSPYFHAMFNAFVEQNSSRVTLHDMNDKIDAVECLVDFAYTSRVDITEENVQRLLAVADFFQIANVKEACSDYLAHHLDAANCLGVWCYAESLNCSTLATKVFIYIKEKFASVALEDEFLRLPFDHVHLLASNLELNVCCEDQVCDAVLRWVEHDVQARSCHLVDLLSTIRLELLHKVNLHSELFQHPLVRNDTHTAAKIREVLLSNNHETFSLPKRRSFPGLDDIIVLGGGNVFEQHANGERYISQENSWVEMMPMLTKRVRHAVAVAQGKVFALGGHDGTYCLRTVECYDPEKGHWFLVEPMNSPRDSAAVAVYSHHICMIGGHNGVNRMNSVEVYDAKNDSWDSLPEMKLSLTSASAATLGDDIYVCGGNNGSHFLDSVQKFNFRTREWSMAPPMNHARNRLAVVAYGGKLYATGGLSCSGEWLRACECYDPTTETWTDFRSLSVSRCRHCAAVADGYIYVVGGFGSRETVHLSSVERYDPELDEWTDVEPLSVRRGGAGIGVLSKERPKCRHKAKKTGFLKESKC